MKDDEEFSYCKTRVDHNCIPSWFRWFPTLCRRPESLGYILPWFEVALAIFLILGIFIRPAAIASALLMLMFIGAIASVWARGMLIDCGCLGGGGAIDPSKATEARIAYAVDIVRDIAFVGMCLYIFKYPYGKFSMDKKPETTTQASEDQE